MSVVRLYKFLLVVTAIPLLASACGPSQPANSSNSTISTAVAQTVQAQNTPVETLSVPSVTEPPAVLDTPASLPPSTATVPATIAAAVKPELCTPSAAFAGETYPDGTIVLPDTTFTKVWKVQNTSTCAWDSNWQLVFYGGDQLGGLSVYKFPQPAQPGEIVDVPVILKAPSANGTYTGKWMLKAPSGKLFGMGQYSVPLVVSIVVGSTTPANNKTSTVFDVTAVTYKVDRRCALANTFYTITAFVTSNGPLKAVFSTLQSDGHRENNFNVNFTEATTHSFQWEWSQKKDSSTNSRWAQVILTSPTYKEFDPVVLPNLCTF